MLKTGDVFVVVKSFGDIAKTLCTSEEGLCKYVIIGDVLTFMGSSDDVHDCFLTTNGLCLYKTEFFESDVKHGRLKEIS